MLTNAILEMWKKETGSLSSVVIEGTVCISSGNGRTTVIQVSDKFNGVIPEANGWQENMMVGTRTVVSGSPYQYAPHVDTRPPSSVTMAAYLDELSPASLVSPSTDSQQASTTRRTSVNSEVAQMEVSTVHVKEEVLSDESGCDVTDDGTDKKAAGPVCAGTGYYCMARSPATADPASPSGSLGELQIAEEQQPALSTPKSAEDLKDKQNDSGIGDSISKDPLDLSPKDSDLALSPPQSYTAQVRDVIRQRLLAGRHLAMAENKPEAMAGQAAPATSTSSSSFYPVMLKSLGKAAPAEKKHMGTVHPYKPPSSAAFLASSASSQLANGHALLTSSLSGSYAANLKQGSAYSGPLHSMLSRTQTPSPSPSNPDSSSNSTTSSSAGSSSSSNSNDQKTYKCDFCAKTFLFKSKYHEHLPVHTNARPFKCGMCSRTYKYKYDLRVHLRTHMGIPTKSTVCPFCTAKYDSNKQLRLHIKEVHGDRPKMPEGEIPQLSENTPPQADRFKRESVDNMPVFPGAFPVERPKSAELKSSYENLPVFPGLERPKSADLKTMQPSENLPVFPGNFAVLPPVEGAKVPEAPETGASAADAAAAAAPEPKPAPDSTAAVEASSTEVAATS